MTRAGAKAAFFLVWAVGILVKLLVEDLVGGDVPTAYEIAFGVLWAGCLLAWLGLWLRDARRARRGG